MVFFFFVSSVTNHDVEERSFSELLIGVGPGDRGVVRAVNPKVNGK